MNDDERFVVGSGNVYEDLGFEDPEGELAKADLAIEIIKVIRARGLTQQEAGEIMGIQQPKVSRIMRGRLEGISGDALIGYLRKLGQNIELNVVTPEPVTETKRPSMGSYVVNSFGYGEACHEPMAANSRSKDKVNFN